MPVLSIYKWENLNYINLKNIVHAESQDVSMNVKKSGGALNAGRKKNIKKRRKNMAKWGEKKSVPVEAVVTPAPAAGKYTCGCPKGDVGVVLGICPEHR